MNIWDSLYWIAVRTIWYLRQPIFRNRLIFEWIWRSIEETSWYWYTINSSWVSFVANNEWYNDLVSSMAWSNTQYVTTSNFNRSNWQDIGISVWINPSTLSGYQSIVSSRDTTFSWILYLHTTWNKVSLHWSAQNPWSYTPPTNAWTHIVCNVETINSVQYSKMYINWVLTDTVSWYSYNAQSPTRLLIWDTNWTERFLWNIKLLRIFSWPLTQKEINKLYMEWKGLVH